MVEQLADGLEPLLLTPILERQYSGILLQKRHHKEYFSEFMPPFWPPTPRCVAAGLARTDARPGDAEVGTAPPHGP